jgi:hypothetical protein
MPRDAAADRRARLLGQRVDALARALHAAGADPDSASRLLAAAAAAALDAVALDLLQERRAHDRRERRPRPAARRDETLPLAA